MAGRSEIKALSAVFLFEALLRRLQARGLLDDADRRAVIDDAVAEWARLDPEHPGQDFVRAAFNVPTPPPARRPRRRT